MKNKKFEFLNLFVNIFIIFASCIGNTF